MQDKKEMDFVKRADSSKHSFVRCRWLPPIRIASYSYLLGWSTRKKGCYKDVTLPISSKAGITCKWRRENHVFHWWQPWQIELVPV